MVHRSLAALKALIVSAAARVKTHANRFYFGIFLLSALIAVFTINFLVEQRGGLQAIRSERAFKSVSLQSVADSWAESFSGQKSLVIFDLLSKSTLARLSADQTFPIRSASDFFLGYETALRLSNNFYQSTSEIEPGVSYLDCLKSLLATNNASCRSALLAQVGSASLTASLRSRYGLRTSTLDSSTAADLATLFRLYYDPANFSSTVAGTINLGIAPTSNPDPALTLPIGTALYARFDQGEGPDKTPFSHLIGTLNLSNNRKILLVALTTSATPANFSALIADILAKLPK